MFERVPKSLSEVYGLFYWASVRPMTAVHETYGTLDALHDGRRPDQGEVMEIWT